MWDNVLETFRRMRRALQRPEDGIAEAGPTRIFHCIQVSTQAGSWCVLPEAGAGLLRSTCLCHCSCSSILLNAYKANCRHLMSDLSPSWMELKVSLCAYGTHQGMASMSWTAPSMFTAMTARSLDSLIRNLCRPRTLQARKHR